MLHDVARVGSPEVHAIGPEPSLGLDEGHGRVLNVEIAAFGKRVIDAIHTERLKQPEIDEFKESQRRNLPLTSNEDSGWKLSTARRELTARVWKDRSLALPLNGAAETALARATAK